MKNARTFVIPLFLALAALAPRPADAQAAASLVPMPRAQFFDSAGRPLAGGCVWTYAAGSSTPLNSYKNAAGTANANPVVLDASGRADIWLGAAQAYKISVSAKTSAGCVAATTPLYTADNVIDQGFALVRQLQNGSLAIGLRGLPITGTGGGVGVGNAMLSATVDGLYVSVNGAAPVLLSGGGGTGGGGAAGPVTSLQYNGGGSPAALAGTANLSWDAGARVLEVCKAPATGCSYAAGSGIESPLFSSFGHTAENAFITNLVNADGTISAGTSHVNNDGNAYFQGVAVTNTFNSLATGPTLAITQASKTFNITGAGDAGFQTMGLGLHANPTQGFGGGQDHGEALLSATTAGLYISLDGAPPVLVGGGGGSGTPGGVSTNIQYNNSGTFAGSANMKWNSGTPGQILIICGAPATGCDANSGVEAPTFSSFGLSGDSGFETNVRDATGTVTGVGTAHINNSGDAYFQGVNVTATFNSLATGITSAIQQNNGTFRITGAGDFLGQTMALGLHAAPVTGHGGYPGDPFGNALLSATTAGMYISLNGAAPVLIGGGGGSGTPGLPNTSIQYNNAGTFAGNAALNWDNTNTVLNSPVFSCTTLTAAYCFKTSTGNASIQGNGLITGQSFSATTAYVSVAAGTTQAFSTSGSPGAVINGQGDGSFRSLAIAGGAYGLNNSGVLTVSSCVGCVGTAAGANTQVQFNNGGVFGASSNFTWNAGTAVLNISGTNGGMIGNTFTANAAGGNYGFQLANNNWQVDISGNVSQKGSLLLSNAAGTYRSIGFITGSATSRWYMGTDNGTESGGNTGSNFFLYRYSDAGSQLDIPFTINRSDGVIRMVDGWAVGGYGLNASGALNVASCTGCAGVPGAPANAVQFNNGAGGFGGSSNFTWDGTNGVVNSPVFSCLTTAATYCFKTSSGNASINGDGSIAGATVAANTTFTSLATGGTLAFKVGSFGLTGSGALIVSSCSGCGGGGASVGGAGTIQFSNGSGGFNGSSNLFWNAGLSAMTLTGTLTTTGIVTAPSYSCQAIGAATCITSGTGTWSINGNGTFLGQSIATGANNGTLATQGQGATISNSGAAIGMVVYDNTGHCNIGTGSFVCSSDERLKKNIAPIGDALRAVNALRPVSFDWRGNGAPGLGFIAQDVQKVLPGLVTTDKGGYLELSEINMIPYLVRSIQQLQAEVDALRSRAGVAALYDQLSK